jgi:hypothetical protein
MNWASRSHDILIPLLSTRAPAGLGAATQAAQASQAYEREILKIRADWACTVQKAKNVIYSMVYLINFNV